MTRRSVLAVRADSLGDVVLTGPAVRALARDASVTMLVSRVGEPAARALPGVDNVLVHDLPWIVADPEPVDCRATNALLRDVERVAPELAVIFTSFHQSALPLALLLRLAGVGRIAAISSEYPGSLLDVRHAVDDDVHEVERSLSLAVAVGGELAPDDDDRLRLTVGAPNVTGLPSRPYVVVHPGASVPARAWAPERHRELVRRLTTRGTRVVVTGTGAERALTRFVADGGAGAALDLGGQTPFPVLTEVLAGADVVVTGNTGPAHVAAAVSTPVASLYAPTVPAARWRPWRVPHLLLGDQEIACAGCRARECPVRGHPCLDVPVARVVDAVDALSRARTVAGVTS